MPSIARSSRPRSCPYFTFDLQRVARQSLYLDRLEGTETILEVAERIATFERPAGVRPWVTYPH